MKKSNPKPPNVNPPDKVYQPRRYFTPKLGRKIDAHDYGYQAWPIGKSGKK